MALKAGPKPQHTRKLPAQTGSVSEWVKLVTGQALYPWQAEELDRLTAPDRPRVAYIQVPRKNGKTRLAAALALAEVCLKEQRHVFAISDSERNLNSVLIREVRDLIFGSEHLRDSIHVFKNLIEVPETGSFIEPRPSKFAASQGINPHLVLFDEVHLQKTPDIWHGMTMAGAAREDALLFGITTPGYDLTSLAHDLYQALKTGDDTLYGRVFDMPTQYKLDDRKGWRVSNPCYDVGVFADSMEADFARLPEHEFRRFRLGQWTATESAWLPYGAWDACASGGPLPPDGTRVWVGFDGSYSGDSTAIVGVTEERHIFVIECWENPGRRDWRVPRAEVDVAVQMVMERWRVVELLCDPPYWEREIEEWRQKWPSKVIEFPTHVRARMAPACFTFYTGVMEHQLTHDGDPRLARHVANAIIKPSPQGDYITKADKDSPAKIDLAVAAVVAFSRAALAAKRSPVTVV